MPNNRWRSYWCQNHLRIDQSRWSCDCCSWSFAYIQRGYFCYTSRIGIDIFLKRRCFKMSVGVKEVSFTFWFAHHKRPHFATISEISWTINGGLQKRAVNQGGFVLKNSARARSQNRNHSSFSARFRTIKPHILQYQDYLLWHMREAAGSKFTVEQLEWVYANLERLAAAEHKLTSAPEMRYSNWRKIG